MIYLADYKGRRVLWEGSLPYVTVDHQRETLDVEDDPGEVARPVVGAARHAHDRRARCACSRSAAASSCRRAFVAGPVPLHAAVAVPRRRPAVPVADDLRPRRPRPAHVSPALAVRLRSRRRARRRVRALRGRPLAARRARGLVPVLAARPTSSGNVWRQVDFGSGASINIRPHSWDDAEVFAIRYHDGEWAPFSPRSAAGSAAVPGGVRRRRGARRRRRHAVVRRARPLRSVVPVHRRAVDPRRGPRRSG